MAVTKKTATNAEKKKASARALPVKGKGKGKAKKASAKAVAQAQEEVVDDQNKVLSRLSSLPRQQKPSLMRKISSFARLS